MNSLSPFKALLKRLMSEKTGSASEIKESFPIASDLERRHICIMAGHGEGKTTGQMNDPEFQQRLADKMKATGSSVHIAGPHSFGKTENPEALQALLAEPNISIAEVTDPDAVEYVQTLSETKVI